jgi:hypothetical protein
MNYKEILKEIEKKIKYLKWKKYRTNIIDDNKVYRELCYQIWLLEEQKKRLLNLIENEW